jgi:AcrR family transcriptional regulator
MGRGAVTRGRILERAIEVASRDGLQGLTIGRLADELGLSKSGLYAHFGSKEELEVRVLERAVARFRAQVVVPAFGAPRGRPRLEAVFERWLAWGAGSGMPGGCLITAAASELDDQPGRPREVLAAALSQWLSALERLAAEAVEVGDLRADVDPRQFAYDLYAIFLAFHLAHRMMRDPEAEARARRAFERLIEDDGSGTAGV